MKRIFIFLMIPALLTACATQQQLPQNTPIDEGEYYVAGSPARELARKRILPDPINGLGQTNDPNIRVTDIRLTSNYTVLYVTFTNNSSYSSGSSSISFRPEAKLVARDGREFSLVKADGIPLSPRDMDVRAGDRVDFVLYFKRLDNDIDQFAMYECKSDNQFTCWNVIGLNVNNPTTNTSASSPNR